MTEISNENTYFVADRGGQPLKPLQDEYHWITPAITPESTVPAVPKTAVTGYDCTQPKAGPVYGK